MTRTISLKGKIISYELEYKKVKNINIRIKSDCSVYVSASKRVSVREIEELLLEKADFILNAIEKFEKKNKKVQYFSEKEITEVITKICERVYPLYRARGISFPQLKFRKMVSKWGSCRPTQGILTFNKNLMYAPPECIEYVVHHEFTHFIQANHSKKFYEELAKTCPDWKTLREKLRRIKIR